MRVFWSIIALLLAATIALYVTSARKPAAPETAADTSPPPTPSAADNPRPRPPHPTSVEPQPAPPLPSAKQTEAAPPLNPPSTQKPMPAEATAKPDLKAPATETPAVVPAPTTPPVEPNAKAPDAPKAVAPSSPPTTPPTPAPAPADKPKDATPPSTPTPAAKPTTDPDKLAEDLAAVLQSPTTLPGAEQPKPAASSGSPANGVGGAAAGEHPAGNGAAAPPPPPLAPLRLETQDDGSVLVDGRFIMRGKGTKADPYIVTWEQLMSAQETYQPRRGQKTIPERLTMLHGKWVKMSGYVAFPIMAESPDEMLVMLNQWDGCCIGVPPTPYDAIEVKLSRSAEGEDRLLFNGTVTGVLKVDPFLVKDWLVSLYLMEEATLTK